MGYKLTPAGFGALLDELATNYQIFGPVRYAGKGRLADTDLTTYGPVRSVSDLVWDARTTFAPKEVFFPVKESLLYFSGQEITEPSLEMKETLVFLRACDLNAVSRLDKIFLANGPEPDSYYARRRQHIHFVLMECQESFPGCFCVSMGTNMATGHQAALRLENDHYLLQALAEPWIALGERYGQPARVEPVWVEKNPLTVRVPERVDIALFQHELWREYACRCIACGRCTLSCPTCSCFSVQDVIYRDNPERGERRRVWASCQIDGFTDMAGGHQVRADRGDRMRFKVLHKIDDFRWRFGINMCVGCGRCEEVCPEYISFARCVNTLNQLMEVQGRDA